MFNLLLMLMIFNVIISSNSWAMGLVGLQQKPQGHPLKIKKDLVNSKRFKPNTHTYVHDFHDGGKFFITKFPPSYLNKKDIPLDCFASHIEDYNLVTDDKIDWLASNLVLNIQRLNRCQFDNSKEIKQEFSFLREDTKMLLRHINEYKVDLQGLIDFCKKRDTSSSLTLSSLNNDLKRLNAVAELAKKFYESLH